MKAKRVFSLLIAIVMVVGIFVIPASAISGVTCGACYELYGSSTINMRYEYTAWETTAQTRVEGCAYSSGTHVHMTQKRRVYEICRQHGGLNDYIEWRYNQCSG